MSRWLREITTTATGNGTGIPFAACCLAWYFDEILGYLTYSESATFKSSTKNGTAGEINLTSTDKDFRDTAAASFVVGDVGKWLVVKSSNARNSGIYQIAAYVSATTVTLDFRSGATEYPTAETGMTWWVIDPTSAPSVEGSYFRCQTPSALGWAIECALYNISSNPCIRVRLAADGTWGVGEKIVGTIYFGSFGGAVNWLYAEGDESGEWVNIWFHQATNNRYNGCIVSNLDPFETARIDVEKIALMGNVGVLRDDYDNGNFIRNYDSKRVGRGSIWVEDRGEPGAGERWVYFLEPTSAGYSYGLSKWTSRERNHRRSGSQMGYFTGDSLTFSAGTVTLTASASFTTADIGKTICISNCSNAGNNGIFVITARPSSTQIEFLNASGVTETSSFSWSMDFQDIIEGSYIISDENNIWGIYEVYARLKGHYSVRGGMTGGWSNRKAFSDVEFLDRYHINDGIAVAWPNLTPQH